MKPFWMTIFLLAGAVGVFVGGCASFYRVTKAKEETAIPIGPAIRADCVVIYYAADGSRYISRQRHTIWPESDTILISANEPTGLLEWKLSGGSFQTTGSQGRGNNVPIKLCDRNIALVILTSITAGGGFVSSKPDAALEPLKIQGQWYRSLGPDFGAGGWSKRTIYQNMNRMIMDRVFVEDLERGVFLVGAGYDFGWLEELGRSLPIKIDVFNSDNTGVRLRRILQIHYSYY